MTLPLHSTLLRHAGVQHGFFGARNELGAGVDFASVAPGAVALRQAALAQLGLPSGHLALLKQVHSNRVIAVEAGTDLSALAGIEADALITGCSDLAVGVLSADCVPILILAADIGWVGAIHAGRRGALAGILGQTIMALRQRGADLSGLRLAVGPHISASSYEVGQAMYETMPSVAQHRAEDGRFCCDLGALLAQEIDDLGIHSNQLEWLAEDTYSSARMHSYRRDGAAAGRQLSAIARRDVS